MWRLLPMVLAACASAPAQRDTGAPDLASPFAGRAPHSFVWQADDPTGDVRLVHPERPGIEPGTFDLERFSLTKVDGRWRMEATFAAPVKAIAETRAARDRVVEMVPQTIDIYLDTRSDAGHIDALPGRGFKVSAGEAWDRVLVVSALPDLSEDDLVHAQRVTPSGRKLIATFAGEAVPDDVRGILVVVLATSAVGDGRVRPVGPSGECRVWDDTRCTLSGNGPPVLDALALDVRAGRPLALSYRDGQRPRPTGTPVVFTRGSLLSVAPVAADEVAQGRLATVVDAAGDPLGTAIVLSVVGDTASLEVVGGGELAGAHAVIFAGVTP